MIIFGCDKLCWGVVGEAASLPVCEVGGFSDLLGRRMETFAWVSAVATCPRTSSAGVCPVWPHPYSPVRWGEPWWWKSQWWQHCGHHPICEVGDHEPTVPGKIWPRGSTETNSTNLRRTPQQTRVNPRKNCGMCQKHKPCNKDYTAVMSNAAFMSTAAMMSTVAVMFTAAFVATAAVMSIAAMMSTACCREDKAIYMMKEGSKKGEKKSGDTLNLVQPSVRSGCTQLHSSPSICTYCTVSPV